MESFVNRRPVVKQVMRSEAEAARRDFTIPPRDVHRQLSPVSPELPQTTITSREHAFGRMVMNREMTALRAYNLLGTVALE